MGILNNIFGSNSNEEPGSFNWIPLTAMNQLNDIITVSETKTVVIFKHSTRCGISSNVLRKFEKATDSETETIAFYYLDLLNYRAISTEIAQLFNVHHQSPQVLVIQKGKVIAHESHYEIISSLNLKDYS
jgi:bacillithiol system protein YtxJ